MRPAGGAVGGAVARAFATALLVAACRDAGTPSSAPVDAAAAAPSAPPARAARYLALGDSFTIGTGAPRDGAFPSRLADRWRAAGCAVTLKNVAVNGYTTDDVIAEELSAVSTFAPTLVTLAVGANDIVRGKTLGEYRLNVRRILGAARASGARVVALPQPDWSRSPAAAAFGTPEEIGAKIRAFNAALAEDAAASGASYVDLAPLMRTQADARMVAADGLHPSAEAYDAWAAELARAVTSPCS